MSKKDEALQLALEALEWINRVNAMEYEYQQKARESLNAIYEALAEQPAQRTWVGLTDEEYSQLHDGFHQQGKLLGWVVDQVEAKLKEKNNG